MVLQGNRVYLVRVDPIRLTAKLKNSSDYLQL